MAFIAFIVTTLFFSLSIWWYEFLNSFAAKAAFFLFTSTDKNVVDIHVSNRTRSYTLLTQPTDHHSIHFISFVSAWEKTFQDNYIKKKCECIMHRFDKSLICILNESKLHKKQQQQQHREICTFLEKLMHTTHRNRCLWCAYEWNRKCSHWKGY